MIPKKIEVTIKIKIKKCKTKQNDRNVASIPKAEKRMNNTSSQCFKIIIIINDNNSNNNEATDQN